MNSIAASATYLAPPIAAAITSAICLKQSDKPRTFTSDNFILWATTTITVVAVALAYFANYPTIALGFAFLGLLTIYSLSGNSENSQLIEKINQLRKDSDSLRDQAKKMGETNNTFESAIDGLRTENTCFEENIRTFRNNLDDLFLRIETMSGLNSNLETVGNEFRTSIKSLISQIERLEQVYTTTEARLARVLKNQQGLSWQNTNNQQMLEYQGQMLRQLLTFNGITITERKPDSVESLYDNPELIYPVLKTARSSPSNETGRSYQQVDNLPRGNSPIRSGSAFSECSSFTEVNPPSIYGEERHAGAIFVAKSDSIPTPSKSSKNP